MGDVLEFRAATRSPNRAYALFSKAAKLDEDPETVDEAESLYRQAIHLDPGLSLAYTNLGNIHFRRQDVEGAETLFRKALEVDSTQPEAQYNLGLLLLERGDEKGSIPFFEGAIKADEDFADAHFNLAMSLESLCRFDEAQKHWRKYMKLEPEGTYHEIAKRHIRG